MSSFPGNRLVFYAVVLSISKHVYLWDLFWPKVYMTLQPDRSVLINLHFILQGGCVAHLHKLLNIESSSQVKFPQLHCHCLEKKRALVCYNKKRILDYISSVTQN